MKLTPLALLGLVAGSLLCACANNTDHAATTQDLESQAREISVAIGESPAADGPSEGMQPAGEVAPEVTEAAAPSLDDVTDELSPAPAEGPAVVGSAAPEFRLQDQLGRAHSLSDFRGSPVVLEWFNHGCPFVKKHYGTDNMQGLQRRYTEQGVVWLSICSSAEGKQGFTPQAELVAMAESNGMASTAVMADADGAVGRLYGATNTPQMFVIDAAGTLVYAGAIDDDSSASKASVEGAYNYVAATLDALLAGDAVEPLETQPYGCGVKY